MVAKLKEQFKDERAKQNEQCEQEKAWYRKQFEMEKEEKEKLIRNMENSRSYSHLGATRYQTVQEDIDFYAKKANKLEEKNAIAAEGVSLYQLHKLQEERNMLIKERDETLHKLKQAEYLHSKAMEAIAETTDSNCTLIHLPYEDEINVWKERINVFVSTNSKNNILRGLPMMQVGLEELLNKMYVESKLSAEVAHETLANVIEETERHANSVQGKLLEQRNEVLQRLKTKRLTDNIEEEIAHLRNINQAMAVSNESLRDTARLKVYLKGITQLKDLTRDFIKKCSIVVKNNDLQRDHHCPCLYQLTITDSEILQQNV